MKKDSSHFSAFRSVPKTGVIYVMAEAEANGFSYGNPLWANLGQGAAETGEIPDCADRLLNIKMSDQSHEYSHVMGIPALRAAIADLYNLRYRQGMASQYTAENVAISSGGRAGLTRIIASLGQVNLGHFIPDYTAYEELLNLFRHLVPIPIMLRQEEGFRADHHMLRERVMGLGLGAILFSNPCNPTGEVICGDELDKWLEVMREFKSCMIADEFYAHYHYDNISQDHAISAAAYIEDVNKDQLVIVDGLSKNWRYPGLRLSWTIAPKKIIKSIAAAGSFLDGGANHPVQEAVIPLLEHHTANKEAKAIQSHFDHKRQYTIGRLKKMGLVLHNQPKGAFYAFASLENMPESLKDGFDFFQQALKYNVICVPGVFFDVDPGQRRSYFASRLSGFVRISYGPPLPELTRGLDALEKLIRDVKNK